MKRMAEQLGLRALHQVDPETAHGLAITALRLGLAPTPGPVTSKRLKTSLAGMSLPNPVGLAAGFDKNATAVAPLSNAGFGFIEVGAATPLPQPGNEGMQAICTRLARRGAGVPVGLNLGANKTSTDRAADFARVMELARDHVDFATVNVSSPNTEKLRDLQGKAALAALLAGVMEVRGDTPVFLKIAPDLTEAEIADVAEVANDADVAAIIATNTTLDRTGLKNAQRDQMGGLSGVPLFEKSTRVLARLSTLTDIPLVGVGGIGSAEDAYAKICAGASAVQLYTALVYSGLSLAADIAKGLDKLLKQDGFDTVADAVGSNRSAWL
jgi:dihydroorotate dehydrogenase